MKQQTIFGFCNFRYYVSNPRGAISWYPTREARDAARDRLIEEARAKGLQDPDTAFEPCMKTIRSPGRWAWFAELKAKDVLRLPDDPTHVWHEADA